MKKFVALLLVLCMALTMTAALAEETTTVTTYMMAAAVDAEGNYVDLETAQLPVLVLAIDSATNECAFGTEEETVAGTYEIVTGEDDVLVLYVVLADGSEVVMFYVAEDDAWMLVDEATGMSMFLFNLEVLAAEADAA